MSRPNASRWSASHQHPNRGALWSDEQDVELKRMRQTMEVGEIAARLGRTEMSVRHRLHALGVVKRRMWTPDEERRLVETYERAGDDGYLDLEGLALEMGRDAGNLSRKAASLNLVRSRGRLKAAERKVRTRSFATDEERNSHTSERMKRYFRENGHPRGALGIKHTAETLSVISEKSKARWASLSQEERVAHTTKMMATRAANGYAPPTVARGTWKAGWREIGGRRNFYRSRWEANYARYLEWLKQIGEISDWAHEPEVFWFDAIKRGARSYKPDFRVWENDGTSALHEVKGWMDSRSRTCLARMAKYHPNERVVLIDGRQYRAIRLKVMRLIDGWEDHQRDSHA